MKFLCDVHISIGLVKFLSKKFPDTIHVNAILSSWNTSDEEIIQYADKNDYVIISKDKDFKNSHLLRNKPKKLIKINLGNISNAELIKIFEINSDEILKFETQKSFLIEIDSTEINYIH